MSERICSIEECTNPSAKRGWCEKHYQRWRKYRDPAYPVQVHDPSLRPAWLRSVLADTSRSGCRDWVWACSSKGYGQIHVEGRLRLVTHVVLEMDGRPRPDGLIALHSCDRPQCVAPWHLRWGTNRENTADMMTRGRQVVVRGSSNGRTKLTDAEVLAIRKLRASGWTCAQVAERYGIHSAHVSRISRGLRRETVE